MTDSVCPGCAHEQACGHAEVHACANRVPVRWCSCDMLKQAKAEREAEIVRLEGERDKYREKAIRYLCGARSAWCGCNGMCIMPKGAYCDDVIKEVDA